MKDILRILAIYGLVLLSNGCLDSNKGKPNVNKSRSNRESDSTYKVVEYFENGKMNKVWSYKNDELHGLSLEYNQIIGHVVNEQVYIEGNLFVNANFGKINKSDTLFGVGYYYPFDSMLYIIGSNIWNREGRLIPNMNSYFINYAEDTITYGEDYEVELAFKYGNVNDLSLKLIIGELNGQFMFTDTANVRTLESENQKLKYKYNNYHIGDNLILGYVSVYKDGVNTTPLHLKDFPGADTEFRYYHNFYVKSSPN